MRVFNLVQSFYSNGTRNNTDAYLVGYDFQGFCSMWLFFRIAIYLSVYLKLCNVTYSTKLSHTPCFLLLYPPLDSTPSCSVAHRLNLH